MFKKIKNFQKKKVKQGRIGGYGKFAYPPHPTSFNFINGMKMKIVLNKQGTVEMGVTRSKPASLSSLDRDVPYYF